MFYFYFLLGLVMCLFPKAGACERADGAHHGGRVDSALSEGSWRGFGELANGNGRDGRAASQKPRIECSIMHKVHSGLREKGGLPWVSGAWYFEAGGAGRRRWSAHKKEPPGFYVTAACDGGRFSLRAVPYPVAR